MSLPLICRALRIDWRELGDALAPVVALGLVVLRLGCFFNGCCFGRVSALPWALAFPPRSWVHWYHQEHGLIGPGEPYSLPTEPVQLCFALAAAAIGLLLLILKGRGLYPGFLQLLFYFLYFATNALIEPLRQTPLTVNNLLNPTAAVIAGSVLLAGSFRRWRAAVPATSRPPG